MTAYNDIEMHRRMVSDEVRTRRFRESIMASVKPGDTVLDIGAGSGILSLFAAQAGASRIYAVEREPGAVALATQMINDNNFGDRIEILETDIEHAVIPEQVDVIISEWLGVYGVDENMLAPVLLGRDRWLKPGGIMIPDQVTAWLAPISHEAGKTAIEFHDRPYGLNLTALAPFDINEAIWLPQGVTPSELCAEPAMLWTVDTLSMPLADAVKPYAAELSFMLSKSAVNALATWFTATMPGSTDLSNAPDAPPTHWGHFLFPVIKALDMQEGSQLNVGFHNVPRRDGGSNHLWSLHDNNGAILEAHDTRRVHRHPADPPWRVAAAL